MRQYLRALFPLALDLDRFNARRRDLLGLIEAIRCELEWSASFDEDLTLSIIQWSSLTRIMREL